MPAAAAQQACAPDPALPPTLKRAPIEQADRLYWQSTPLLVGHRAGDDPIRLAGASRDGRYEITPDGQRATEVSEYA
jgi:hypothetical protein